MVSITQCLQKADELQGTSDTARLDVELLLARAMAQSRTFLYTWPERALTPAQLIRFNELLARRTRGEPMAYLLGKKEFWSLSLRVNESTLIPRPETELLVETSLSLLPTQHCRVLDLGTGSGAIALALASERPDWDILAVDSNPAALQLAAENCSRYSFGNVEFCRSDWFNAVGEQSFDLIVSNPPYVDVDDPHLNEGDLRFEPRSALIADDHGLADIRHIVDRARQYLNSAGWLLVEHGYRQGDSVRALFAGTGYAAVATKQDLSARDRLTLGQHSG